MQKNYSRRHGGQVSSFRRRPQRTHAARSRFAEKKIDVTRYINTNAVQTSTSAYTPQYRFGDFPIESQLQKNIQAKGYILPTPIQDKSINVILEGKDIVGIANTGTGKTAAFLIPLVHKVLTGHREQVLIVVPTRELALQIQNELKDFILHTRVFSTVLVGGAPIGRQINFLRQFNHFVIGTPGRIKDLINRKALDLSNFSTVVLDEADRMLDMGFIADMRFMMDRMPTRRHTLFFSATISRDIEKLITDFLHDPVRISVKTGDTSKNVYQDVVRINGKEKIDVLHDLLQDSRYEKVLVFGRTKHGVQKLSDMLSKKGHASVAIHGNKSQSQRERALNDFKTSKARILTATDVAARGLDIPNVSHVINFDVPATHEDYIHRIGRTGRGDKIGKALTFIE